MKLGTRGWGSTGVLVLSLCGCGDEKAPSVPAGGDLRPTCEVPGEMRCAGAVLSTCGADQFLGQQNCAEEGLTCDEDYGCVLCAPNQIACDGATRKRCTVDGSALEALEECAAGTQCSREGCRDLCADARAERSYLGCEYWPTFTSNSQLDPVFDPAVVVANPNLVAADVVIERTGSDTVRMTVPPQSSQSIYLAFDTLLKGNQTGLEGSVLVPSGAYRLRSSVPVTVHQFNPLLYQIDQDCEADATDQKGDERCNSFTNDASLLLPTHVLSRAEGDGVSYLGIARPTFISQALDGSARGDFPGFLAITATGERAVEVTLRLKAHVRPSADGAIPPLAPGDTLVRTLAPGDVLELRSGSPEGCAGGQTAIISPMTSADFQVCDPGPAYDLTGTEIEADGAIQVIGGHDCTYVPFDRPACDHLEESLFPVETWGKSVVVTRPRARGLREYVLRIVSAEDQNPIRFEPPLIEGFTLARGEHRDVALSEHVIVHGEKPLAVAQFLEGQAESAESGDPSMSLAIPLDQFRSSYYFLSPDTYQADFANVVASVNADVLLDGFLLESWEPIEGTAYRVAVVSMRSAGQHVVESVDGDPIGLVLYGFGSYTSYMMPGGLDLNIIANPL